MFSMLIWGERYTYPNTNGSGAVISDEHDQPVMCISIDKIEYPQGRLIPFFKGRQKLENITQPQYLLNVFINWPM